MEQLWAPWRLGYVTDPAEKAKFEEARIKRFRDSLNVKVGG